MGLGSQQELTKDRWLGHVLYEDCQPPYTATCIFPLGLIVYPLSTREGRKPRAHVSALPLTGRGTLPLGSSDAPAMSGSNQMCPSGSGEGWRKCRCNSVSQFWLSCQRLRTKQVMLSTLPSKGGARPAGWASREPGDSNSHIEGLRKGPKEEFPWREVWECGGVCPAPLPSGLVRDFQGGCVSRGPPEKQNQ